ncbi:hypothetical protein GCM10020369_44370 [Cryptosporangium minutisporangium]|uniref:Uncharacterized protein n=1 Tax=Cryptosporangium minutisporangium TaxID=113569 RepID=A0ABP6T128_9ACTN
MADPDSPRDYRDSLHAQEPRAVSRRDQDRVAETLGPSPLRPRSEASYSPRSPRSPADAATPSAPSRNRALALMLTAPDVVPLTSKQHRQAVNILAAMIVDWAHRETDRPRNTTPQHP